MLSFTLLLTSASAQSLEKKGAQRNLILEEVTKVAEKLDVEIVTDNSQIPKGERLSFQTVEEFEAFLATFKSLDAIDSSIPRTLPHMFSFDPSKPITSSEVLNWWAPFTGWGMTGLACWKNIAFSYTYSLKDGLKSVSDDITSYLSGIKIAVSWVQTAKSGNIYTNSQGSGINFNVKGYYLLGLTVGGFEIGAKINDSWSRDFKYSVNT